MKTNGMDISYHPQVKRWSCEWFYTVTTAEQFTDVARSAQGNGKTFWTAMFNAWRKARKLANLEKALPGEREEKGWDP